jgi:4-hydroxybenzoyl-CoA thioesterase
MLSNTRLIRVQHRVTKAGVAALEGFEKRVWTTRDPNDPDRLRSAPIPAEVLAGFGCR